MDKILQQRLLGAGILLAILVIVVPELLDGAGHRSRYPSSVEIPDAPTFKPMPEVEQLPIEQPLITSQPVPDAVSEVPATPEIVPVTPIKPVAEKPAAVTASQPLAPTTVKPAVAKPVAVKPVAVKPMTVKPAWALQVGSFSEQTNALKMRDQFRSKGYTTYVDKEQGSYRVRIGPELDQQRVEKILDKVLKQEKIKGIIVTHP